MASHEIYCTVNQYCFDAIFVVGAFQCFGIPEIPNEIQSQSGDLQ